MPNSTMIQNVDRGFFTFYSQFGACTVRVWLYKGDNSPKHLVRVC
jgi:ribosomal protein S3